jgi:molybdopterin-containing oxidoreductase family membrane subunit
MASSVSNTSANPVDPNNPRETWEILGPGQSYASVADDISGVVLKKPVTKGWLLGLLVAFGLLNGLMFALTYLFAKGVGIWGVNIPIGWGFAIVNFVWWVGIGHAGTFISAILLLVKQQWRTSINRFSEAMTLFAVACAGIFPLAHVGRPWLAYWLLPLPNTMTLWPQWRSPLMWDVFAVSTYITVSAVFWYVGLVPDLAVMKDKATQTWKRKLFGGLSLGWRGSARHWQRYETAYIILAGLATPLVLSVHSIVSMDFSVSMIPGWHTTIFPPYFVAGAIFSGFAMVLTLAIPMRKFYHLEHLITRRHLDSAAKLMLTTGLLVAYGYLMEHFIAWYSGVEFEWFMIRNRQSGPYWWCYAILMSCNVVIPQLLWFKRIRQNLYWLFALSIVVNIGMWMERFIIVVTSIHRDFLPSSWGIFYPTFWDWMTYLGTFGLFFFLFLLFLRGLPAIAISEIQGLVDQTKHHHGDAHHDGGHHG